MRPSSLARLETVVVLAAAAILAVMFLIVWLQSSKYEPLLVGKVAPDFQLPDLNDKQLRLSDYRGKVVFLNFWATWCKPCREEMPSMEVLYKNFEKDGLIDPRRQHRSCHHQEGNSAVRQGAQSHVSRIDRLLGAD